MKIIRNFSKTITIVLHIAILTLTIIAFFFALNKSLFVAKEETFNFYSTYTGFSPVYTLPGLISFSDNFILNSSANSQITNYINFTDELLASAKTIKVLAIVIFILFAGFAISQLFNFRLFATLASLVVLLVLFIILKSYCVTNFEEVKLIIASTRPLKSIINLLTIATAISFVQVAFNIYLKQTA